MSNPIVDELVQRLDIKGLKRALGENVNITRENYQNVTNLLTAYEKVTNEISNLNFQLEENAKQIQELDENYSSLTEEQLDLLDALIKEESALKKELAKRESEKRSTTSKYKQTTGSSDIETASQHQSKKAAKAAKMGKAAAVAGVVGEIVGSIANTITTVHVSKMQQEHNTWMAQQKTKLNALDAGGKVLTRNIQLVGKTQQAVMGAVVAQLTEGANAGAHQAAQAMTEIGVNAVTNMYDNEQDLMQMSIANRMALMEAENKNLKLQGEINKAVVSGITSVLSSAIPGAGGLIAGAIGGIVGSIMDGMQRVNEAESEIELEQAKMQMDLNFKQVEVINQAKKAALEAAQGMANEVLKLSQLVEKTVAETDKSARQTALALGLSGKNVESFTRKFFASAQNLSFTDSKGKRTYLDKNHEDMMKIQSSYIDASGRNQVMNRNDMLKTFQLGKVLGDDELAATLLGDMDYFNKSIQDGTGLIYDMFKAANKAGVSNKKFAKELQNNLKLAQKYTFKGGVKNMMEMSIWAQKTRFNMDSIANVIDKGLDNGIEGIIKSSAQLQVLGGKAALFSDPLSMMYEMGNDPEALAKRINSMVADYGYFDKSTGEAKLSMSDRQTLKAIAEALGMDVTELRNQATQSIKSKEIDKQLNKDYTEQEKSLLYSKAQYDTKSGTWKVTLDNGEKRDINDIRKNEWAQLMPTEEAIEDYVSKIHDILAQEHGAKNYSNAKMAKNGMNKIMDHYNKRISNALTLVDDPGKFKTIMGEIDMAVEYTTTSQVNANNLLIASSAAVSKMFGILQLSQKEAITKVSESSNDFKTALNLVEAELTGSKDKIAEFTEELANAIGILTGITVGDEFSTKEKNIVALYDYLHDFKYNSDAVWGSLNESTIRDKDKFNAWASTAMSEVMDEGAIEDFISGLNIKGYNNKQDLESNLWNIREFLWDFAQAKIKMDDEKRSIISENIDLYTPKKINPQEIAMKERQSGNAYVEVPDAVNYVKVKDAAPPPSGATLMSGVKAKAKQTQDGFMEGNGKSMLTTASKVTPINDGVVAQSHPQDTALFAKAGGPFDTLFNKVFAQIDSMYHLFNSRQTPTTNSNQPIKIQINGDLNLKSDGQSVNLMELLNQNPTAMTGLTEFIINQLSKNVNGGKTYMFNRLQHFG